MPTTTDPVPELTSIAEALERTRTEKAAEWEQLATLKDWEIYTDGSAPIQNPGGPIGFSTVFLLGDGGALEVYGGVAGRTTEPPTSNNRAEISGVIAVFEMLYLQKSEGKPLPRSVVIVCDSQYVVNCAQGRWKKHKNRDLWARLDQLLSVARQNKVKIEYRWTKAHVGTQWNERADVLAKEGAFLVVDIREESPSQAPPMTGSARSLKPVLQVPQAQYSLSLYAEMTGKTRAKGAYRLSTPSRFRDQVQDISNVLTLDEAEYWLLSDGLNDLVTTLEKAGSLATEFSVSVRSSRELMLKQIQGFYGVKSERLIPLHRKAIIQARKFASVSWHQVSKPELVESLKVW